MTKSFHAQNIKQNQLKKLGARNINKDILCLKKENYLLGIIIWRSSVAIALTVNGRISATADGIHLPSSEIVVDDMNVAVSTPRHPLHQRLTEVIERYGHLHPHV